jgi:hypothetical protein
MRSSASRMIAQTYRRYRLLSHWHHLVPTYHKTVLTKTLVLQCAIRVYLAKCRLYRLQQEYEEEHFSFGHDFYTSSELENWEAFGFNLGDTWFPISPVAPAAVSSDAVSDTPNAAPSDDDSMRRRLAVERCLQSVTLIGYGSVPRMISIPWNVHGQNQSASTMDDNSSNNATTTTTTTTTATPSKKGKKSSKGGEGKVNQKEKEKEKEDRVATTYPIYANNPLTEIVTMLDIPERPPGSSFPSLALSEDRDSGSGGSNATTLQKLQPCLGVVSMWDGHDQTVEKEREKHVVAARDAIASTSLPPTMGKGEEVKQNPNRSSIHRSLLEFWVSREQWRQDEKERESNEQERRIKEKEEQQLRMQQLAEQKEEEKEEEVEDDDEDDDEDEEETEDEEESDDEEEEETQQEETIGREDDHDKVEKSSEGRDGVSVVGTAMEVQKIPPPQLANHATKCLKHFVLQNAFSKTWGSPTLPSASSVFAFLDDHDYDKSIIDFASHRIEDIDSALTDSRIHEIPLCESLVHKFL